MVLTRRKAAELGLTPVKAPDGGVTYVDSPVVVSAADAKASVPPASVAKAKTWADTAGTGDRNSFLGLSGAVGSTVAVAGSAILMAICPAFAIYNWFTLTQLNGSLVHFYQYVAEGGWPALRAAWPTPSQRAWTFVAVFGLLQAFLQLAVPGKVFKGPITPKGNVPVYKANGVQRYLVTLAIFFGSTYAGIFRPAEVYDLFGEILSALNIFSLLLCAALYFKGFLAPSSSDSGTTGSMVYDFFWGMELYPRIGKHFDIKTWTNCGMGMLGWVVLPLCYAAKQHELYGSVSNTMLISVALQQIYMFKFFLWETGYWGSMDIAHDRAGYYICWGCLVWVPSVYTAPALFLVKQPVNLHPAAAAALFLAGTAMVLINYDADRQRQVFRATNGKTPVWGSPPKIVHAEYATGDGKTSKSILLASGWWGIARHFHYLPEILGALCWTLPALNTAFLPYFYVTFLTILLTDRAYRDDSRCAAKYGKYWRQYCALVPYKMVPYVF